MQLVVIRHAIAEERETFAATGRPDAERPLTDRGTRRMRRGVRGLVSVLPAIDRLVSSPYVRARQTADLVAEPYGVAVETHEILTPGHGPDAVAAWLAEAGGASTLAIVGHEPDLSALVSYLLSGVHDPAVELKKGAACLLDVAEPARGGATLCWLLAPKQLRRLGGGG